MLACMALLHRWIDVAVLQNAKLRKACPLLGSEASQEILLRDPIHDLSASPNLGNDGDVSASHQDSYLQPQGSSSQTQALQSSCLSLLLSLAFNGFHVAEALKMVIAKSLDHGGLQGSDEQTLQQQPAKQCIDEALAWNALLHEDDWIGRAGEGTGAEAITADACGILSAGYDRDKPELNDMSSRIMRIIQDPICQDDACRAWRAVLSRRIEASDDFERALRALHGVQ